MPPPLSCWTAGANVATRDDHAGYWEGYLEDLVAVLDEEA